MPAIATTLLEQRKLLSLVKLEKYIQLIKPQYKINTFKFIPSNFRSRCSS